MKQKTPYIGFFNEVILPNMGGKPKVPVRPIQRHVLTNVTNEHLHARRQNAKVMSLLERGLISPDMFPREPPAAAQRPQESESEDEFAVTAEPPDPVDSSDEATTISSEYHFEPKNVVPRSEQDKLELSSPCSVSERPVIAKELQASEQNPQAQQPLEQSDLNLMGEWVEYGTENRTESFVEPPSRPQTHDEVSLQQLVRPQPTDSTTMPLQSEERTQYYTSLANQLLEELEQLRPRVGFEIANYHTYVAVIKQKYTPANPRATDSSVAKDNIVALSTVMEKEPLVLDQHQAKLLMQLESIFLQLPDQIDLEAIRKSLKIFKRPQSIKAGYIKNTPETQTDTISFIQYKIN